MSGGGWAATQKRLPAPADCRQMGKPAPRTPGRPGARALGEAAHWPGTRSGSSLRLERRIGNLRACGQPGRRPPGAARRRAGRAIPSSGGTARTAAAAAATATTEIVTAPAQISGAHGQRPPPRRSILRPSPLSAKPPLPSTRGRGGSRPAARCTSPAMASLSGSGWHPRRCVTTSWCVAVPASKERPDGRLAERSGRVHTLIRPLRPLALFLSCFSLLASQHLAFSLFPRPYPHDLVAGPSGRAGALATVRCRCHTVSNSAVQPFRCNRVGPRGGGANEIVPPGARHALPSAPHQRSRSGNQRAGRKQNPSRRGDTCPRGWKLLTRRPGSR